MAKCVWEESHRTLPSINVGDLIGSFSEPFPVAAWLYSRGGCCDVANFTEPDLDGHFQCRISVASVPVATLSGTTPFRQQTEPCPATSPPMTAVDSRAYHLDQQEIATVLMLSMFMQSPTASALPVGDEGVRAGPAIG
jgi:hypothetical protein